MGKNMTKSFIFIILLQLCLTAQSDASSGEDKYLEARDGFVRKFATAAPAESDNQRALAELERQLRLMIGPVRIAGFPAQGRINLATLYRHDGFGQVDGLRFDSGQKILFVTTIALLKNYLNLHKTLPTELSGLAKNEEFYSLVFDWHAAVTNFVEVPINSSNNKSSAYAFLGLWAQDIGLFLPKTVFVFVSNESRVFIVSVPAQTPIYQIPECQSEWEDFEKKASAALDVFRASAFKDQKAIDDKFRYEQEGFDAYRSCFERKARTEPFFERLTRQAQSIVDQIQQR